MKEEDGLPSNHRSARAEAYGEGEQEAREKVVDKRQSRQQDELSAR
jgi:hypothetical protein